MERIKAFHVSFASKGVYSVAGYVKSVNEP